MGTLGKKGNKVFELPVLSFHFISLPRHTARRAHLDLGLGPRMTNARGAIFSHSVLSLFQPINGIWGVWGGGGESGKGLVCRRAASTRCQP